MPWYTLQTQPNNENNVIRQIESRKKEKNLNIKEIFAPEEPIITYKDGVKKERLKKIYTNYVFIDMVYDEEMHHHLKNLKGVVGFVGTKNNPTILPEYEITRMKEKIATSGPKYKVEFKEGATVKINGGSFDGYEGIIESVEYEKNKAKVGISIFGRTTSVDFELSSLENKVNS